MHRIWWDRICFTGQDIYERVWQDREDSTWAVVTCVLDHLDAQQHTSVLKMHVETLLWTRSFTCCILGLYLKPTIPRNNVRITVWMSIYECMHILVFIFILILIIIVFLRGNKLCPTRSGPPYLRGLAQLNGWCEFDFGIDASFYPELSSRCAVFECRPANW